MLGDLTVHEEVAGEFYPLELDRYDFWREEINFVKQKCEMDETDTRYTRHNIDASDAYIQDQSGVTEILRYQPNFYEFVDPTYRI